MVNHAVLYGRSNVLRALVLKQDPRDEARQSESSSEEKQPNGDRTRSQKNESQYPLQSQKLSFPVTGVLF